MDFDSVLLRLWSTNASTRLICLKTITNLVDDVQINDDPVAGLRGPLLAAGTIAITASADTVSKYYASNPQSLVLGVPIQAGAPGWLQRVSQEIVDGGPDELLPLLSTIRSCLSWMITPAIVEAKIMQRACNALMHRSVAVQICAVDCLYILLTRPLHQNDELLPDIYSLYNKESLAALSEVWQATSAALRFSDGTLNDEERYTMLKKLTETIIALACFKFGFTIKQHSEDIDLADILDLVLLTWQHKSLIISGMANNFWCSLLRDERLNDHAHVSARYAQILEIGSQRLLRFEDAKAQMLLGSELQMYLDLDLENMPELHAFCGNYKRFIFDIVRMVVFKRPLQAIDWARAQVINFFSREYAVTSGPDFSSKTNPMFLSGESKFFLVEATLRGVWRFKERLNAMEIAAAGEAIEQAQGLPKYDKADLASMRGLIDRCEAEILKWCSELLQLQFQDPLMLGRHITTLVAFSMFLPGRADLLFGILEKVIQTITNAYPGEQSNGVTDQTLTNYRELRSRCGTELIRLASTLPDELWSIFPQLESTVNNILTKSTALESEHTTFNAVLLAISQRTKNATEQEKSVEFGKVLTRLCAAWDTPELAQGLTVFDNFIRVLQVDRISEYMRSRRLVKASQLDQQRLDEEGQALVKSMKDARNWVWPVRASRRFVETTMDGTSEMRNFERQLWKEPIRRILPNLLRLLSAINLYYNPGSWLNSSLEMRLLAKESILERFWLHGVSQVSKDEFLEASQKSSDLCRELCHSLGHFLRRTREYCLAALGTYCILGEHFYTIPNVGKDSMQALFGDTSGTSLHVWATTITTSVRPLILNCPPAAFDSVLIDIMTHFPNIILTKLQSEWGKLMERGALQTKEEEDQDQSGKDDYSSEMMEESLLRHLSFSTIKLMSDMLTPPITTLRVDRNAPGLGRSNLSDWLLRQESIVGGIMLLLSFLLTVNDTRTAINAAKILRAIIPFLMEHDQLQRYVCHEVFSATIRCIHDPYFVSIQGDLINLLTHIYYLSLNKSTIPREILLSIPQMSGDVGLIKQFESTLGNAQSDRTRRSIMHELLLNHEIVGREGYGRSTGTRTKLGADVTTREVIKRFQQSVSLQPAVDGGDLEITALFQQ